MYQEEAKFVKPLSKVDLKQEFKFYVPWYVKVELLIRNFINIFFGN